MAITNITDLERRWKTLSGNERNQAEAFIEDTEALIESSGVDLAKAKLDVLIPVVCAAVKRAMMTGEESLALTSQQITAGPYSQTLSFANPTGDIYLTKNERKRLGIRSQRIFSLPLQMGGDPK